MSDLFKHSLVVGVCNALQDAGALSFPNEKIAFEVSAAVASSLQGPEIPDGPLDRESTALIGNMLKNAADQYAAKGYRPTAQDLALSKQASQMDFGTRIATIAEACMAKAASDASLTDVEPLTPENAAQVDQVNRLDQQNRSTNKYNVGFGKTQMPSGGVVGMQRFINGDSHSNSLSALDKQASVEEILAKLKGMPASAAHSARMFGADIGDAARQYGQDFQDIADTAGMAWHNRNPNSGLSKDDLMAVLKSMGPAAKKTGIGLGAAGAIGGAGYGAYRMAGGGGDGEKEASDGSMSAEDLNIEPLQRGALFLNAASRIPGYEPDNAALVAAAGLGAGGQGGLEVMAAFVDNIKTASDADAAIQQILNHQGEMGELASPELVQALQAYLAQGGDGSEGAPEGMPANDMDGPQEGMKAAGDRRRSIVLAPASGLAKQELPGFLSKHKGKVMAAGAAAAALGAGAAALSGKKDDEKKKTASLLERLKAASDGSLTNVEALTPENGAKVDQVNKLDLQNRGVNEHNLGPGKTKMPSSGQGAMQTKAPKSESSGVNNSLDAEKQAEEAEYAANFRRIAEVYGPHLPANLSTNEKVAHVQSLMAMPPDQRGNYVLSLR